MQSFRNRHNQLTNNTQPTDNGNKPAVDPNDPILQQLGQMDQQQLTQTLFSAAQQAKQQGTLNAQSLQAFYTAMAPNLTPQQQQTMQQLISQILST